MSGAIDASLEDLDNGDIVVGKEDVNGVNGSAKQRHIDVSEEVVERRRSPVGDRHVIRRLNDTNQNRRTRGTSTKAVRERERAAAEG